MGVKIFFAGNILAGDDGIGPRLYHLLKDDATLKGCMLYEIGVLGLDMMSYVDADDKVIIVDAVDASHLEDEGYDKKIDIGSVFILEESHIPEEFSVVSQHDFGVEQVVKLMRAYYPDLDTIRIIGIFVHETEPFRDSLSEDLTEKLPAIRDKVLEMLTKTISEVA